ncbi:RNA-binding protein 43 [Mastacembelus armatus]|uniref:RNA-binding protein 43 n=1 Tax=Mastacembelus armatus TaxID=205130 RepID=UPI000E45C10B|nr:uncharacterized protein LOC113126038 [Mastacembelus armatus]
MDFQLEATVHLGDFQDQTEVRKILRSHDFAVTTLDRNKVRIKGSYVNLKAAKARLEQLLSSQTQTEIRPYSSSHRPDRTVSSGAVSKYSNTTGRSGSRDKPRQSSPSSPYSSASYPASPQHRSVSPPRPDQSASSRAGHESFVVERDVFKYAEQFRRKEIDNILISHDAKMTVDYFGESCNITLKGKGAQKAAGKLQSLLNHLSQSLRTQEVPRRDMDREGKALLEKVRHNKNIYKSVLLCEMTDSLHLVGPSGESYELKQMLLRRQDNQSGHTGSRFTKLLPRNRSWSLAARRSRTIANLSQPVGAVGYTPSKYQDDKQEGAAARPGQSAALSRSESSDNKRVERTSGFWKDTRNKRRSSWRKYFCI